MIGDSPIQKNQEGRFIPTFFCHHS